MTAKDKFFQIAYEKLKAAILSIDDRIKSDVYAISFWFYTDDDDPRYPVIMVSFNTNTHFQSQISSASSTEEAKWNYAFWLQEDIDKIGGSEDELLKKWFATTPYFYSDEENEQSDEDDDLFDEILDKGSEFCNEFIEEIILLTQRLFAKRIVANKFDKNIPILIHELEYYDRPVNWTIRSNPKGLVDEFVSWAK